MSQPGDDDPAFDLAEAYAVEGPEQNRDLYAIWAETYDSDFIERTQYVYHQRVAALLASGLDTPGQAVLDVGCGTGVVGLALRAVGVFPVDGIDISPEMLTKAGSKTHDGEPVYRHLIEADLTGSIDVATDGYAAIISAGVFTHGHLGPDSLDELLRVAAPGAGCVIGINSVHFEEMGFAARFDVLISAGRISAFRVEAEPIYLDADGTDPNQIASVAMFTVV